MQEQTAPIPQRILDYIEENPGTQLYEIVKAAGCARSTARYYLERFAELGQIEIENTNGRRRYYSKSQRHTAEERCLIAFRKNGTKQAILDILQENPGLTREEIACHTGKKKEALVRHLCEMRGAGVIIRERDGHAWRYSLGEKYACGR